MSDGIIMDTKLILKHLAQGRSVEDLLSEHPHLTHDHLRLAARIALNALEGDGAPRVETRAERVARLRQKHPRAYEPWTQEEDARLLLRYAEGAKVAQLARDMGRQPNAVRARLEKWLGERWRDERGMVPLNRNTL